MAVQSIWWWPVRPWSGSGGGQQSWSMDVSIPAETVYAFAAMQNFSFATEGYPGNFSAFGGVASYTKSGVPQPVGNDQRNGVLPGIFDSEVDTVTFSWGVLAGEDRETGADFTFQIFGFG